MSDMSYVVICATARLANGLRWVHAAEQVAAGKSQWQPLPALTISQWLEQCVERALLQGYLDLAQLPRKVLTANQEQVLWEQVIEQALPDASAALFDLSGMAASAMEAHRLMSEWSLTVPGTDYAEEVTAFLAWRHSFQRQCAQAGWQTGSQYLDWQISQIQQGKLQLPDCVYVAGVDRVSPQLQRLFDAIQARGVSFTSWAHLNVGNAAATKQGFADSDAECRAVVGWALAQRQQNPQARLGIVVPELERLRPRLAALLDAALHPVALSGHFAEMPRDYDFSLGISLAKQPLIATALQLLRIGAGRRELSQQDISGMLLQPFWASGFAEADGRAQLDAAMRADLPTRMSLERLVRFVQKHVARGLLLQNTSQALDTLFDTLLELPARQLPSGWSREFTRLLEIVGWPGDRPISSHEYQARKKFEETLLALGEFDALLGNISFAQAVQRLQRVTAEQVFQPETEGDPHLFIMGMLETVAKPMDAIWVMGMNDHLWPPPARPNPLLPAGLQRAAGLPGADGSVQATFAQTIHERLLRSAGQLIFSYAHKDGDRELRPSPLLQAVPDAADMPPFAFSLSEQLAQPASRELLDDHLAPAITPEERVRGGTGLLKAQAICPAWAYYRYRLGAKRMDAPIDGLDAMGRGTLLHAALQQFWQGHDSTYLHALTDTALQDAIEAAVESGFRLFEQTLEEPLPPNFVSLEKQRLRILLESWLSYEKAREPFTVVACEQKTPVEIASIKINLMIDRIDRLEKGGLVVIDYKTGTTITQRSWADARITEPQLPLYASIALADEEVAAVCFAQVRADTQKFIGVAANADAVPEVKALAEAAKVFPPEIFADWPALLSVWRARITEVAAELARGEAGVVFQDEADLRDCDVKPILRLPERKLQMEHLRSGEVK